MKKKQTNVRNKYVCPTKLQEFIDLSNLIVEENIEEIQETFKQENSHIQAKLDQIGRSDKWTMHDFFLWEVEAGKLGGQLERTVRKIINNKEIARFIFYDFDQGFKDALKTPTTRFNEILRARQLLVKIADYNPSPFNLGIYNQDEILPFDAYLELDKEGFLRPRFSEFMSIFQNENIFYVNIRLCKVCNKIFWAKREKSQACSRKCTNVLINREYRNTNKDQINGNRRLRYKKTRKREK